MMHRPIGAQSHRPLATVDVLELGLLRVICRKSPILIFQHLRCPIEMYKILSGKYDTTVTPRVNREYCSKTRGNDLRLQKTRVTYDLRKYWNSLPNHVVLSDTVNMFKSRLDKFWQHQDLIYDFKAEISGTGSRSCY